MNKPSCGCGRESAADSLKRSHDISRALTSAATRRKEYTRREALEKLSPAVLLSLGLWPGALAAAPSGGSFRFIVVNDLHYINAACGQWLEKMTRQMKAHGDIELCLVAGDLTEHGRPEHHGAVREILRAFGIPAYVV